MSGSYTQTPNIGLFKPTPNSDTGTWGFHLNSNADTLDALLASTGTAAVFLPLAGGQMTGPLALVADPTTNLQAATKQYVDAQITGAGVYLELNGGTMTGPLMYTATGGTTSRSAQSRAGEVYDVKDFGAVGNGLVNDTAAVQAAFNAAAAGGEVYFPPGTYLLSGAVTQTCTGNVAVRGAGAGVSVLNCAASGIALTFGSNMVADVSGLSIISTVAAGTNTGLAITSADQSTTASLSNLIVRGNAANTTAWQTGISLANVGLPKLNDIVVVMPNGNATAGPTGIYYTGSTSNYATSFRMVNSLIQGGQYGLRVGNWVQGVYLVDTDIIGNDYGVVWLASAGANEWLAISNCHFNCDNYGVYTNVVNNVTVSNSLFLHFPVGSNHWYAVYVQSCLNAVVSNNQITGNNAATHEWGIVLDNCGTSPATVSGNVIGNVNDVGILVSNNTANASVVGNSITNTGLSIQDTTGLLTNQCAANSGNSHPDISFQNNVLSSFGGFAFNSSSGAISGTNWAHQGGYLGWNFGGNGMTNFINSRGGGTGGFSFYDTATSSSSTPLLLLSFQQTASSINLTMPILINAANDAAAATAGVSVGMLYRNGSAVMQRVA